MHLPMTHQESPDITNARKLLIMFAGSQDHEKRTGYFEEAIELLAQYSEDDSDPHERRVAHNIQRAYTKTLLEQLPSLDTLDIGDWFYYWILLAKVKASAEGLCTEHPVLNKNYNSFINNRASEALNTLSRYGYTKEP
jgi:hypothetical protein